MIEKIKKKLSESIVDFKLKKQNLIHLSFPQIVNNSKYIFLVLPERESDFKNALDILRYFEIYKKTLTVFTYDFRVNLFPWKHKYKIITFNLNDVSFLELPKKDLREKLRGLKFDLAIDLNREDNIFFSYITNLVEAKAKIGCSQIKIGKYYNLQFQNNEENPEIFYKNFLNCLQMF